MFSDSVAQSPYQLADFHQTAGTFLRDILGLSLDECFLSDQSELDDFASIGRSEPAEQGTPVSWAAAVLAKIHHTYGVSLTSTRIYLVDIFAQIEQAKRAARH